MQIGDRLVNARKAAGMSQKALADAVGVWTQSVWRWEHGETTPSGTHVRRLAETLNVTTDYLLGGGE